MSTGPQLIRAGVLHTSGMSKLLSVRRFVIRKDSEASPLCSLTDVDRLEDCRRDLFIAEGLAKVDRQEEARRNSEMKDEWSAEDVGILLWARCTRAPLFEALRMGRRLVHTPALTDRSSLARLG